MNGISQATALSHKASKTRVIERNTYIDRQVQGCTVKDELCEQVMCRTSE